MEKDVFTFIKEHTYINYCECLIYPNGLVGYAQPSHIMAMMRYTGKTQEEINEEMPVTAMPLYWLIEKTGCIAVYTDGYLKPSSITKEQEHSLSALVNNNLTSKKSYR